MALVRAILRSDLKDLTIVSWGGADVGLLARAGKIRKLVYAFVSLDSIPLEPHFRTARQTGAVEVTEWDEGMLQWGLYAAGCRLPFLPTRVGLGSDVMTVNPDLRTVRSPYTDEELVAVSCERIVPTAELTAQAPVQTVKVQRWMVRGVVEAPNGAHFTSCDPDYGRDEAFQREYVTAAGDPTAWKEFVARYLEGDEAAYQAAVAARSGTGVAA
jgi:glutaconate CoA-transferase subunit A